MNVFLLLKALHMGCALVSISGFTVRWFAMMFNASWLDHPVARRLPHLVDTVFLLSGLGLAVIISQYPFVHSWLTAKVLGLLFYILFGALALKYAPGRIWKFFFFVLALFTFAYIVGVAGTWHPLSWYTLFKRNAL